MHSGRSVCSWISVSMPASSSASSTSGIPALTSSMSAPAATCASTSTTTVERSPPRSSSANFLRPVGLIRSPITQNGWSWPMVTVLDRDSRTVCMLQGLLSFDSWWDPETRAQLGDARVLPEGDEVQPGHARQRQRVRGQLVGEVEAGLLLIGGGLHPLDDLGRHLDARHLVVDEAQGARRA